MALGEIIWVNGLTVVVYVSELLCPSRASDLANSWWSKELGSCRTFAVASVMPSGPGVEVCCMMVTRSRIWLGVGAGKLGAVVGGAAGPKTGLDDTPRVEGMVDVCVLGSVGLGTTVRLSVLMQVKDRFTPLVTWREGGFFGRLVS